MVLFELGIHCVIHVMKFPSCYVNYVRFAAAQAESEGSRNIQVEVNKT